MEKVARDFMTSDPACCRPHTMLDQVAKMMVQYDCGEIPVLDITDRPIGVVTDRDIVCRVVAERKNPMAHPAETCMSEVVVTVRADAPIREVVSTMVHHRVRRVLVVDASGCCIGIISQADVVFARAGHVGELVREVSSASASSARSAVPGSRHRRR
jgi:CBS domain-containing protein